MLLIAVQAEAQSIFSSNLPIIFINTNNQQILDEPKIMADMGIIYNGPQATNNTTDAYNHYQGKIGIEIRGQSSQLFPMKSYSIELWDNAGKTFDKSLFGLPKESDWVLYAPYTDKTLMRNFLAYTMSADLGHWSANCRFVELIVNNDYKGVYVFMEKIKRNSGRVNIPKINTTDISGDALTGGYIISIDKEADGWFSGIAPHFSTANQRIQYSYVYPKKTALVPAQENYIKSYVDSFENALAGNAYQNKLTGWRAFADESSFIDYLLVNEVSRNVDGYRLSSFFYKDRQSKNGKLVAGPVWDYDLAFRNANYCRGSDETGWSFQFNQVCPQDYWQVPFWWDRLMTDTAFQAALTCRWQALRSTALSNNRIFYLIDSAATLTAIARSRHFGRWPVLGQYVWPNPQPIATSYDVEIVYLKNWLTQRLIWLDNNMPNTGACNRFPPSATYSLLVETYPNPFRSFLVMNIMSKKAVTMQVDIVDALGRTLFSQRYTLAAGKQNVQIPSQAWSNGLYFLRYSTSLGEKGSMQVMKIR